MTSRDALLGAWPGRPWIRVGHGVHRGPGATALQAWQLVLPPGAAFSHLTAAALHGWWAPDLGSRPLPVMVDQPRHLPRSRRHGLRVTRTIGAVPTSSVHDVPVTTAPATLLSCARDLALLDLVVLVDAALGSGCSAEEIASAASGRRRGAPLLRRALTLADGRSESPWETALRMLHMVVGAPTTAQHVVRDADGRFVARGDLHLDGTRTLHEYDGADHRTPVGQAADLRRDRALVAAGWTRRGYVAADLCQRPVTVLRDIDDSLGRAHRPARLRPWREMLEASTFTSTGRIRLLQRLDA